MRKIVLLALVLGSLGTALSADVLEFTPFAGYTSLNMGSVNKAQASYDGIIQEAIYSSSSSYSFSNSYLSGAWMVGGDLLTKRLTPWKSLSLGLRGEFLGTNKATENVGLGTEFIDYSESGSLSSFMLGGRYDLPGANHGLKLSVGAFGGLGYAAMAQDFHVNSGGSAYDQNGLYCGEGFVGDVDFRLDWTIPGLTWLKVNAQTGYRYASLGDLHNGHGDPLEGPGKYLNQLEPSTYPPQPAVDVDFSGLTVGGGLTFSF
ncbi:MAG TPA: hypothetical protein VK914_05695 [bacterium]|jgi:hypothetical protein|nr:hypothetical protein [bacterium]